MTSFEGPRDHPRIPSERRDDQKSSPPRPQSIIGLPKGMGSWSSLAAPPNLMSRGARDYSSILLENSNTGRGASSRLKQASKKLETSEDFPRSFSALRDLTREIVERSRAWHIPFGSISMPHIDVDIFCEELENLSSRDRDPLEEMVLMGYAVLPSLMVYALEAKTIEEIEGNYERATKLARTLSKRVNDLYQVNYDVDLEPTGFITDAILNSLEIAALQFRFAPHARQNHELGMYADPQVMSLLVLPPFGIVPESVVDELGKSLVTLARSKPLERAGYTERGQVDSLGDKIEQRAGKLTSFCFLASERGGTFERIRGVLLLRPYEREYGVSRERTLWAIAAPVVGLPFKVIRAYFADHIEYEKKNGYQAFLDQCFKPWRSG